MVQVLYPAFGFVHGGALAGCGQQRIGVQRDIAAQVHARAVVLLLVAHVQRRPGVQARIGVGYGRRQVPAAVFGPPAGVPVDVGADPDVFHAHRRKCPGHFGWRPLWGEISFTYGRKKKSTMTA